MIYSFMSRSKIRSKLSIVYSSRILVYYLSYSFLLTISEPIDFFFLLSRVLLLEFELRVHFEALIQTDVFLEEKRPTFKDLQKNEKKIEKLFPFGQNPSQRPSTGRIHVKCHLQTKFLQSHSKVCYR